MIARKVRVDKGLSRLVLQRVHDDGERKSVLSLWLAACYLSEMQTKRHVVTFLGALIVQTGLALVLLTGCAAPNMGAQAEDETTTGDVEAANSAAPAELAETRTEDFLIGKWSCDTGGIPYWSGEFTVDGRFVLEGAEGDPPYTFTYSWLLDTVTLLPDPSDDTYSTVQATMPLTVSENAVIEGTVYIPNEGRGDPVTVPFRAEIKGESFDIIIVDSNGEDYPIKCVRG